METYRPRFTVTAVSTVLSKNTWLLIRIHVSPTFPIMVVKYLNRETKLQWWNSSAIYPSLFAIYVFTFQNCRFRRRVDIRLDFICHWTWAGASWHMSSQWIKYRSCWATHSYSYHYITICSFWFPQNLRLNFTSNTPSKKIIHALPKIEFELKHLSSTTIIKHLELL